MKSKIIDLNQLGVRFRGFKNGQTLLWQAIELERLASPDKNPYTALWCPETDQEKRIKKAYSNEIMAHSRATRFYLGDIYDFTTTIERMNHKNA